MNPILLLTATAVVNVLTISTAYSQNVVETASAVSSSAPTTIYRQVLPDGRIVYTDKADKANKVDHTITFEPPAKGNLWTAEPGQQPKMPVKVEHTQIIKAPSLSPEEKKRIADQANANVIRAEMLLEDAVRKQQEGATPQPGEKTSNAEGTARFNDAYQTRQKELAKSTAYAEKNLRRAIDEQAALR
jgi:hypothetical protein